MRESKILILNYHHIRTDSLSVSSIPETDFSITRNVFLSQMELIRQLEIPVLSLDQVSSRVYGHEFAVALTFDDGNASDYLHAFQVLKSIGYTAAFFPLIGKIQSEGFVTWDQLTEMSAEGFTIGSHGISHSSLISLPSDEVKDEIRRSKRVLEEVLKVPVKYFAAPYGLYNEVIIRLLKETAYKSVLTTRFRPNTARDRVDVLDRWNIKQQTTLEQLKSTLLRKGNPPFARRLLSPMIETGKRLAGPELSLKTSSFIHKKSK